LVKKTFPLDNKTTIYIENKITVPFGQNSNSFEHQNNNNDPFGQNNNSFGRQNNNLYGKQNLLHDDIWYL